MTKEVLEWAKASTTGQKKEARTKCGRFRITWIPGGEVSYYSYCDPHYIGTRRDFGEAQQLCLQHLRRSGSKSGTQAK